MSNIDPNAPTEPTLQTLFDMVKSLVDAMTRVEQRLTVIEQRQTGIEQRQTESERRLSVIEQRQTEMYVFMQNVNERIEHVEITLDRVAGVCLQTRGDIREIQKFLREHLPAFQKSTELL